MIIRIVELKINPENLDRARQLLAAVAPKVRGMQGCSHLHILTDIRQSNHITTYSYWDKEEDLNAYRHSEVFKSFWGEIKPLFALPARAWSSNSLHYLP